MEQLIISVSCAKFSFPICASPMRVFSIVLVTAMAWKLPARWGKVSRELASSIEWRKGSGRGGKRRTSMVKLCVGVVDDRVVGSRVDLDRENVVWGDEVGDERTEPLQESREGGRKWGTERERGKEGRN
jgi:hypothetical protein